MDHKRKLEAYLSTQSGHTSTANETAECIRKNFVMVQSFAWQRTTLGLWARHGRRFDFDATRVDLWTGEGQTCRATTQ